MLRTHRLMKGPTVVSANRWDLLALLIIGTLIAGLAWAAHQFSGPFQLGQRIEISLAPHALVGYSLRTVLRMLLALVCSFLFTFTVGTWAAKSRNAERLLVPAIDILQSVPVLGFLSVSVPTLIAFFPGRQWGPETAAIFAVFTSQAWNMVLGFYQSLKTVPPSLTEAAKSLQLTAWQRFWRIEVPFSLPTLLWNSMISMSAGWFFVVASEAIEIKQHVIHLPGIGSYIHQAIVTGDVHAVIWAVSCMFGIILLYDQLFFRPLLFWAERFRMEGDEEQSMEKPWVVSFLQRARLLPLLARFFSGWMHVWVSGFGGRRKRREARVPMRWHQTFWSVGYGLLLLSLLYLACLASGYIFKHVSQKEALHVVVLGAYTAVRVFVLMVICSLIWVPVGVWVGLRPRVARWVQPVVQVLAAFPANILFPLFVLFITRYHLSVNIWAAPLMILGTQWYILFNVIAGTVSLPKSMIYAAKNFGVRGKLWWKRVILPVIFPYYVTGAMSAAGGAWNASIVAERISWHGTTLSASGLGSYIVESTVAGDYPRIALGVGVMCLYVLFFNHLIWQPLYALSESRFQVHTP